MTSSRPASGSGGSRAATSPGLAVAAVARRLGVAPATLRTWDRRYGLGPSGRTAGSHRRYTPEDVARLLVMRRLTLDGVAPVDAARAALAVDADDLEGAPDLLGAALPGGSRGREDRSDLDERGGLADDAGYGTDTDDGDDDDDGEESGTEDGLDDERGGDRVGTGAAEAGDAPVRGARGHLRALPGGGSADAPPSTPAGTPVGSVVSPTGLVSAVVDAALAYDHEQCLRLLRLPSDADPGVWWPQVVEPAWRRVTERTVLAGPGDVPEVVLGTTALRALREFTVTHERESVERGGPPPNHPSRMRRIVLVFAAPDEPLPLSAHALAAALVARGATVRIVTGPANVHRALELVAMVRPAAMVLATMQTRPILDVVHAAHDAHPDLPIFVGLHRDAEATDVPLAPTVQRVRSFTGLLHEVLAIVS